MPALDLSAAHWRKSNRSTTRPPTGNGAPRGPRAAREYWDRVSVVYDSLYRDVWSIRENELVIEQLQALTTRPPRDVLDLGCGTGAGLRLISSVLNIDAYDGVDLSPGMLTKFPNCPGLRQLVLGDMTDLNWATSSSYDLVCSFFGTLSFASSLASVVESVDRVLRPGGWLIASYHSRFSLRRIIRLKTNTDERYATRMDDTSTAETVLAHAYSVRHGSQLLQRFNYITVSVSGDNALSGVLQRNAAWPIGRAIGRTAPAVCHTVSILARKGLS